jgi:glycosyltransferase involved in cell wall biosynthesis
MLASECTAHGMQVTVYGPAQTGQRFLGPGGTAGIPSTPGREVAGAGGGGVRFVTLDIADRPRPARDLRAVLRLRRMLREGAPDVVHAHGLRAGAVAALARRRPGAPGPRRALVVTVHNAAPRGAAGAVYLLLEWIVARRADAVTWVGGDLAERMRRRRAHDGGRALVPAPPAATPTAEQIAAVRREVAEAGERVVLAVGRLTGQKGFAVLLRAAEVWAARGRSPALVIAGAGPLASELAAQARAAGLTVRFLGHRDDIPALLAAADLVVVPSMWEGQPLIVQEALRAGRPLVASRVGGIPDLTGADGALLVPAGDPSALAEAVLSLLDDPDRAARLAAAAVGRAAVLPSVTDAAGAALDLYNRLLK